MRAGETVAVHGCGGVGLSAVQIAVASGARVVAVDVSPQALELARAMGASELVAAGPDAAAQVRELTGGGAALSLDAVGHPDVCVASIWSLARRGRHVQVGLLPPAMGRAVVPMERVIGHELEVLGCHGLAAHHYPALLDLVRSRRVRPDLLVTRELSLEQAGPALTAVGQAPGIAVLRPNG